ncbi:hypothetical protein ACFSC6_18820 [Rufibacter sediminis]|uniref:Response regulatory domain-containing protein n=1 Tax=Rufibacter sediminis TaxID=2762756 RepID=A0ABR6VQU8_9BACT|nr:hypothetical protein [Rufibacter sediminis]MBC3539581.1 hypothetical protein [Rufibacter sediminis]
MNNAKILIVENEEPQKISYLDTIDNFNKKSSVKIIAEVVNNLEDALKAVSEDTFDGAILDLRLNNTSSEASGNEIIRSIVDLKRFPIFIYSGFVGDLDPTIPKSIFFQVYEKSMDFNILLKSFADIFKTGVTRILGKRGILQEYLDKVFWTHLSGTLEYWMDEKNEKTLLRHALTHVIEYLEINEKGSFVNYNPAEVYIKPPIKPFIFTGSILENKDKELSIVLSPACDLAHFGKTKQVLLARIEPLNTPLIEDQKNILRRPIKPDLKPDEYAKDYAKREQAKAVLREIFTNNYAHKYHFLPDCNYFDGGLINFQNIQTITHEGAEAYSQIASVTSSFGKDIIARFSYYYSRQGSPDFDFDKLLKKHTS